MEIKKETQTVIDPEIAKGLTKEEIIKKLSEARYNEQVQILRKLDAQADEYGVFEEVKDLID